jgi:hypothetical protein
MSFKHLETVTIYPSKISKNHPVKAPSLNKTFNSDNPTDRALALSLRMLQKRK